MSDTTLCPQCATRFKVSAEQLDAHDGLVRCGRCQNVFNAREYLQDDEPSPQLSLPIDEAPARADERPSDETDGTRPAEELAAQEDTPAAALEEDAPVEVSDADTHASSDETVTEDEANEHPNLSPIPNLTELEETPTTLAQQVKFVDDPAEESLPATHTRKRHLSTLLGVSLLLLLTAQATYHFRDALAVKLPGLKPLLVELCDRLDCSVELPRDIDLLSIESSELEADAKLVNVITLHALLHNRARYAQAWPSLELTLTDSRDDVIARRTFHPADYLRNEDELESGIGNNREKEIALKLDTTKLRPSGYRLLLLYHQ